MFSSSDDGTGTSLSTALQSSLLSFTPCHPHLLPRKDLSTHFFVFFVYWLRLGERCCQYRRKENHGCDSFFVCVCVCLYLLTPSPSSPHTQTHTFSGEPTRFLHSVSGSSSFLASSSLLPSLSLHRHSTLHGLSSFCARGLLSRCSFSRE